MSDSSRSGGDSRSHARHGVDWRVTLNCPDWHFAGKLAAADASRGGLFLLTSRPPVVGSVVELVIKLPNGEIINILGTVQHVVTPEQADRRGRGPGVGIKFSDEHSETLRLLEQAAVARTRQQAAPAAPGAGLPPPETAPAAPSRPAAPAPSRPAAPAPSKPAAPAPSKPAAPAPAPVRSSGATASAVGIDFGTTFTSISVAVGDTVQIVVDKSGRSLQPSIVHYPEHGEPICGWDARVMLTKSPRRTVSSIKRLIGRSFSDPKIAGLLQATSFKTVGGPNDTILVDIQGDHYAAGQVSAQIVGHVRDLAEAALGKRIEKAVLSIPVTFTELERQSVRRVAQLARVEVIGLIEEPVAAALAYGYGQSKSETVAVYDFGGGTFDFTVLAMDGNNFRVLATDGDSWLGGDDFDLAIAQAVADAFWRVTQVELRQRVVQWQRLLFACERAKRELSVLPVTTILVENLVESPKRMDLRQKLTRQIFEVLAKELFVRSLAVCKSALLRAGLRPENMDQVVVSGGVSRIPFIRQRLGEFFAREVTATVNPEAAICLGAGIRAAQLSHHAVRGAEMYG